MPKITLDEFCSHWVSRTSTRVIVAGWSSTYSTSQLLPVTIPGSSSCPHSLRGGFNGSKWAPRTSKWGKRFTHPLMNDTGTLVRSIQSEAY
ncbi:hypothetical protein NXV13_10430 [Bacteroides ovatus]|nr:hypothetical protein [Bacteroides ovatus]